MDEQNTNLEVADDMTIEERIEHNKIKRAVSESLLEALEIANIKKIKSADEENREISEIVRQAIIAAFKDPEIHCRYSIQPDDHSKQHEALQGFIEFTEKVNGIKWKTLQTLVVYVVMAAFGLMLFGAAVKLKLLTFIGLAG